MMRLRCPVCRKLLEAELRLLGTLCPYCDTGRLVEGPAAVTPELMAEMETAVGFEEWDR